MEASPNYSKKKKIKRYNMLDANSSLVGYNEAYSKYLQCLQTDSSTCEIDSSWAKTVNDNLSLLTNQYHDNVQTIYEMNGKSRDELESKLKFIYDNRNMKFGYQLPDYSNLIWVVVVTIIIYYVLLKL